MGLFDLFKKKEKPAAPAPVTVSTELRSSYVEVAQRTRGELPMADVGGYVSPSGGFVNFGRFKVVGVNAGTGRKNTKRYEAKDEEAARAAAAADGLSEPMTVEVEKLEDPTEQQMAYSQSKVPPKKFSLSGRFLGSPAPQAGEAVTVPSPAFARVVALRRGLLRPLCAVFRPFWRPGCWSPPRSFVPSCGLSGAAVRVPLSDAAHVVVEPGLDLVAELPVDYFSYFRVVYHLRH